MENHLRSIIENSLNDSSIGQNFVDSRIEALKSLTKLLLMEVEALTMVERQDNREKLNLSEAVDQFEIELIRNALIRSGGNQRSAAKLLGTKITTLNAKIKRFGIESLWCNRNSRAKDTVSVI